jgi:sugar lactone lactonase YvrE
MKWIKMCCMVLAAFCVGCKKSGYGTHPTEKKYVVSTIAGDGSDAFADGPVLSAKFHNPVDVAVTSDGTIYVADYNDHRIRKITGGQVYTLAGSDSTGVVNGDGGMARFNNPYRIATDQAGNCYVLDQIDPRIRKITAAGYVTTYAGAASPGFLDGASLVAQFAVNAEGIAVDGTGNVYVGDTFNGRIRKITPAAQVNTVAQFNYPGAVACDRQGNIYVVEEGNLRIRKIATDGVISTLAGSGTRGDKDGDGATAEFDQMGDLVADSQGNLYLIDGERIRKITPAGVVSTIAGSTAGYADGDGADAKFKEPGGLGIDAQDNIYVADINNNRIRKISFE